MCTITFSGEFYTFGLNSPRNNKFLSYFSRVKDEHGEDFCGFLKNETGKEFIYYFFIGLTTLFSFKMCY